MARALDMLDSAIHSPTQDTQADPNGQSQQAENGQQNQPGQNQPGQQGQPSNAMAQSAMSEAAKAAANAMKSARAQKPQQSQESKSELADRSEGGQQAAMPGKSYQTPGEAKNLKIGDWGKLPKKVAEELTQGQREAIAGEYRGQIETYYRVIAEKAKKQ